MSPSLIFRNFHPASDNRGGAALNFTRNGAEFLGSIMEILDSGGIEPLFSAAIWLGFSQSNRVIC